MTPVHGVGPLPQPWHQEEVAICIQVLPQELCNRESHRMWWLLRRSESPPCTSQSRPVCSDLLHLEECCPVSNPCKTGQGHMVNVSFILIGSSWVEEICTSWEIFRRESLDGGDLPQIYLSPGVLSCWSTVDGAATLLSMKKELPWSQKHIKTTVA